MKILIWKRRLEERRLEERRLEEQNVDGAQESKTNKGSALNKQLLVLYNGGSLYTHWLDAESES